MVSKPLRTEDPKFRVVIRDDGIVHAICGNQNHRRGLPWTIEDSLALKEAMIRELPPGEPVYSIADVRNIWISSGESRRVSPIDKTVRLALLVGSRLSRMLGRAYLGLTKPACETSLFTDLDSAVAWLQDGMKKANTKDIPDFPVDD